MRTYIRSLRSRIHLLLREHLTPGAIGLAVGIGVFLGNLPIYGVHIFVCVALSRWLKLNPALLYGAANISNPFFAPFLISLQVALGEWMRHGTLAAMNPTPMEGNFWTMLQRGPDLFLSCLLGSVVLGLALGLVFGLLALVVARRWSRTPRALGVLPGAVPTDFSPEPPTDLSEGGAA